MRDGAAFFILSFDFRLQIMEKVRFEKILNGHSKPVAYFFQRRNGNALVSSADKVVEGRLRNAAFRTQPVEGYVVIAAQFQDTRSGGFSNSHRNHSKFFL